MKKIIVFIFIIGALLFVPIFNVNATESKADYKSLTTITFNNVSHIEINCFSNSNLTNVYETSNIKKTDYNSFILTP